jgi:hypothetical protein
MFAVAAGVLFNEPARSRMSAKWNSTSLFKILAHLTALNLAHKPDDVTVPDRFLEDQATTREL